MAEPANRRDKPTGGKYYEHPVTDERFDSVTTILDIFDKGRLKMWSASLAANEAFELLPQLNRAVLEPECKNTNNLCYRKHGRDARCERCPCNACQPCLTRRLKNLHFAESGRRTDEGTEVHEAARFWVLNGGAEITLSEAAKPYWQQFKQWTLDYGLRPRMGNPLGDPGSWEQTEITLLNRQWMYAGTSDAAVWFVRGATPLSTEICNRLGGKQRVLVRIDYKTREKPDEQLFNDHPLQLVAYDRCTTSMADDGTEYPLLPADACAVLQLRPGGYTFRLTVTDDDTFVAFLGVLAAYRWTEGAGKVAMHPEAFPVTVQPEPVRRAVQDAPDLSTWDEDTSWDDQAVLPPVSLVVDAFEAHTNPAQVTADTGGTEGKRQVAKKTTPRKAAKKATPKAETNVTLEHLRNFDPGQPLLERLDEPLPY